MTSVKNSFFAILNTLHLTLQYYQCFFFFWVFGGDFKSCPYFKNSLRTRVQIYSLALNLYLWDKPHYRNGTYQEDLKKNLRNVAIPGTGVPLSVFCHFKWTAIFFILFINPFICLISAIIQNHFSILKISETYLEQLLSPKDWFSYWRINCILASYHSLKSGAPGYSVEVKWIFLQRAKEKDIAVSPWIELPRIVVKNINEEGGLGIQFFKNASAGGQWIIQEVLDNDPFISSLLPNNAPLSTFRVITASKYGLIEDPPLNDDCIEVLSCVFRAGREGASTDHQSILFDVDKRVGILKAGTTNSHWYNLGFQHFLRGPFVSSHNYFNHPDSNQLITETQIPNFAEILSIAKSAHFHLMPDVPLGGWDVAVTTKGILLLEVNLSCNFFRGSFNEQKYFSILGEYYSSI